MFISLYVVSLFTTGPLKKTVDITLKHIYAGQEVTTKLIKRSLKKLILDTCQKQLSLLMVKCTNKQMVLVWEDL